ncbi:MAG UNVERIFIED_CONTAM: hypothetical protein LVT10_00005 [Anaerolineae bacterium]|jgi:hypothetical protein
MMRISTDRADSCPLAKSPNARAMDKTALLLSMMDEHEKRAFKEALRQQILQEHASPPAWWMKTPFHCRICSSKKEGNHNYSNCACGLDGVGMDAGVDRFGSVCACFGNANLKPPLAHACPAT